MVDHLCLAGGEVYLSAAADGNGGSVPAHG
jgi:hypothetical protein